jgi:hypothetical protein
MARSYTIPVTFFNDGDRRAENARKEIGHLLCRKSFNRERLLGKDNFNTP